MVNYLLATDEQKELANGAREILERELKPQIEVLEHADGGRGQYPLDVHEKLAAAGYFGMNIPEVWGGLGLDIVTQALIAEEMAKVDAGFTFSFYNMGTYFPMIEKSGLTDAEKQDWADRIMSGEARGCFCITEADAGSDATAMRTTAVKDGDEWVISGTKCFASNAPVSNYFLVYPVYYNFMPEEAVLGAYQVIVPSMKSILQCLVCFNMPFTIVKGLFSVVITFLVYKHISPILKGANR